MRKLPADVIFHGVCQQYLPGSFYMKYAKEQINDIVRYADSARLKILGLGALNKVGQLMGHRRSRMDGGHWM